MDQPADRNHLAADRHGSAQGSEVTWVHTEHPAPRADPRPEAGTGRLLGDCEQCQRGGHPAQRRVAAGESAGRRAGARPKSSTPSIRNGADCSWPPWRACWRDGYSFAAIRTRSSRTAAWSTTCTATATRARRSTEVARTAVL